MTTRSVQALVAIASLAIAVVAPTVAHADPPAPRGEGAFEAHATRSADDITRLHLQLGGAFSTGNSQSVLVNGASAFVLRRSTHQLTLEGAFNYGAAWVAPAGSPAGTMRQQNLAAQNFLGRARFDEFFGELTSAYVSLQAYSDVPAGFYSRESGQIGALRNLILVPQLQRFWVELGYDVTYENMVVDPTAPPPLPPSERVLHSARGFVGFEDHHSRLFDLILGLEAIVPLAVEQNSTAPVNAPALFRLNGSAAISSRIGDNFSLALSFVVHYLNTPLPDHQAVDTTTLVSLIYQLESHPPRLTPAPTIVIVPEVSSSPPPSSAPPSGSPAPASGSPSPSPAPSSAPAGA